MHLLYLWWHSLEPEVDSRSAAAHVLCKLGKLILAASTVMYLRGCRAREERSQWPRNGIMAMA